MVLEVKSIEKYKKNIHKYEKNIIVNFKLLFLYVKF